MNSIVLSLGSNIGDRLKCLQQATELLSRRGVKVIKSSSVYETEPFGVKNQPRFLNQVLLVDTSQKPEDLLKTCLDIESDMGRVRVEKHGPRNIDIDVLFYKDHQRDLFNYHLPHRGIAQRRSVLQPLTEIIPEQIHPVEKKSIQQLLDECQDDLGVQVFSRTDSGSDEPALAQEKKPFETSTKSPEVDLSNPFSEAQFKAWISNFGDDPEREGLNDSYRRFVSSRQELFAGYRQNPHDAITLFDSEGYDEMIIVRDLDFFSNCEHHILPFYGRAHIGYIPDKKILGLSKFARVLEIFARRLQNQERLTTQVADFLHEVLEPKGLGIILEAEHLCIKARGADKQNSCVATSAFKGSFKSRPETRSEFLDLAKRSS